MGFYEKTFARIDELSEALDSAATAEEVIDIYDELKRIRRDIYRNPGTRKSYLVPRVTYFLNNARKLIAEKKEAAVNELHVVQKNPRAVVDDYMQMCHTAVVVLAVLAFYVVVLSTGRV